LDVGAYLLEGEGVGVEAGGVGGHGGAVALGDGELVWVGWGVQEPNMDGATKL
jgi:hypothetical protein